MPILLLRKHGYHYEYMDEWEKFNEKSLPKKEESHSNLNIEDVTSFVKILKKKFSWISWLM